MEYLRGSLKITAGVEKLILPPFITSTRLRFKASSGSSIGFCRQLRGRVHGLVDEPRGLTGGVLQRVVDPGAVFEKHGADEAVVHKKGPVPVDGEEAPDQEDDLGQKIKGEPTKDEVREELDDAEEGEDDPIGQPLGVVLFV